MFVLAAQVTAAVILDREILELTTTKLHENKSNMSLNASKLFYIMMYLSW